MPGVSSILQLDPEMRDLIAQLIDKGVTIRAMTAKLRELGADVSKSAVGRYVKTIEQMGERIRRSREIANAIVAARGQEPSDLVRANIESLHSIVFDLQTPNEEGNIVVDAKQAMFLTTAVEKLARAAKTDTEHRRQVRQEMAEEANQALDRVAKTKGLTAETVDALKAEFLGIAKK